jgi:hypothetical protein
MPVNLENIGFQYNINDVLVLLNISAMITMIINPGVWWNINHTSQKLAPLNP